MLGIAGIGYWLLRLTIRNKFLLLSSCTWTSEEAGNHDVRTVARARSSGPLWEFEQAQGEPNLPICIALRPAELTGDRACGSGNGRRSAA